MRIVDHMEYLIDFEVANHVIIGDKDIFLENKEAMFSIPS